MANPHYTESLRRLMDLFAKLPGVGSRSAERIAFHILKSSREEAMALSDALRAVKDQVRHCSICFNLTEGDPCSICADASRDHGVICVVEQPKDLLQLESANVYKGVYHVLLGRIAPLENMTPGELTIVQLMERVSRGGRGKGEGESKEVLSPIPYPLSPPVREIILATNPTMEGDGTALYLQQELGFVAPGIAITRLARGLPAGRRLSIRIRRY